MISVLFNTGFKIWFLPLKIVDAGLKCGKPARLRVRMFLQWPNDLPLPKGEGRGEGAVIGRMEPSRPHKSFASEILGRNQTEALQQILSRIGQQPLLWKFERLRPTTPSIGARRFICTSVTSNP
jgi:hypothetical protein